ncbi:hypothetical protein [Bacillus sp. KH172YL63]|uniref:hypothetical protein n=1 Tax=Bacillus sp. KH172YL63 TaxID=2709784 RepID=UPI0013E4155E|nr:hypothetical protein [Bacillus sp. KH172YL63]BCB02473.1 hypothetical protein KH172YL63_06060 [Bacillus sp. KH172YL63]
MLGKSILILSITASVLMIGLAFLQWNLVEILTPFLMPFAWVASWGYFLTVAVFSLILLFKERNVKPALIQTITVLLLVFFPFTKVVLDMDFKLNKGDRETVVKKVESGDLVPNVAHNDTLIHLPEEYDGLSKGGGEIVVEEKNGETMILFFTFRGILEGFTGFVYSSSDEKPRTGDFGGDFIEIEKLEDHWYVVSSG